MTQPINQEPFTPWHKEPWAWYIVIVLLVTFCWGGFQVYTAFTYQDSVVIDDYYKKGKAINLDMTRINAARKLGISADFLIDDLIGEVRVNVAGDLQNWPDQLRLSLLSPVFADQDKFISLRRSVSGAYIGQLSEQVEGRFYLQLETLDEQIPEQGYQGGWKITSEAVLVPGQSVQMKNSDAP